VRSRDDTVVGETMAARETNREGRAGAPAASGLRTTLLRVAWLAIILGLVMEVLLLALGGVLGNSLGLKPLVADLVRNVSWSVFVCVGLAVGTAVAKARVPLMGFLGLLSAPVAFEASRVIHKGTLQALAVAGTGGDLSPLLVAAIKGLEYGCLGLGVGWVSQRRWGGVLAHVAVGLLVGLVFGGAEIALAAGTTPPPSTADLLGKGVNEILFPVGCSLVLFSATVLGKKVADDD
jgi:hypothetical protein